MNVPERLVHFRAAAGLSQDAVGAAAGRDRTTVIAYESGASNPDLNVLMAMLKACNATLHEFFCSDAPAGSSQEEEDLHWKLARILRGTPQERQGIITNIEYIYGHMTELRRRRGKKSTARKTSASKSALKIGTASTERKDSSSLGESENLPVGHVPRTNRRADRVR